MSNATVTYHCYLHSPDSDSDNVDYFVRRKGLHFIAPLHIAKDKVVLFNYARSMDKDMLTGFFKTANQYQMDMILVYTRSYDNEYEDNCKIELENIMEYFDFKVNTRRRIYARDIQDDDSDFISSDNSDFDEDDACDSDMDVDIEKCYHPFCPHFYDQEHRCKGCDDNYSYELLHDKFLYKSIDEWFLSFNSYVQLYFKCKLQIRSESRVPNLIMLMHIYGIPYTSYISIIKLSGKDTGSLVHFYEFDDWMDIPPIFVESLCTHGDEFVITFLCTEETKSMQKLKKYTGKQQEYLQKYENLVVTHLKDSGNAYYLQKQVILPITSDVLLSPIFEHRDKELEHYSETEQWGKYMTRVLEIYLVADSLSESKLVQAYYPWMKTLEFPSFVDYRSEDEDQDSDFLPE